jgi:eukaryotic-like serine/threonine-protein kinase
MSAPATGDRPEPTDEFATATAPFGLEEGIRIALRAEEDGRVSSLADWLALHPDLAGELASFLAANRGLRSAFGPGRPGREERSGDSWPSAAKLAGFELRGEIGRGGMGVVYRAYDPKLKREVALKWVRSGSFSSAVDEARFRFEAVAVASLDHPAIVPVHASGEADGVPYLVMPLMEGGSLAEKLRALGPDRCLPPKQAARLVRDIALGVHHAHQRGLLHRDLKPANILLDREGRPHVADFGLARAMGVGPGASLSGAVVGTASYMAPEQARGEKGLTTAADVHALGAMLYELLVGKPPFGSGDWMAVLRRVQDEPAPSLRRLRSDVPRDLESICLRCLAKRPEDRYASAQELAEDLSRVLRDEPLGTRRPAWLTYMRRAIDVRRETSSMATWPGLFWGAGILLASQGIAQALVLTAGSGWWTYAPLAANACGWLLGYWWFVIRRAELLTPVERFSSALQVGILLAALALLPAQVAAHRSNVLPYYQPLAVVFGLGTFAHGATHWGRLYLAGLLILAISAAMPLIPEVFWPTAFAIPYGSFMIWVGFRLRDFDRETRSIQQDRPDDPVQAVESSPTNSATADMN